MAEIEQGLAYGHPVISRWITRGLLAFAGAVLSVGLLSIRGLTTMSLGPVTLQALPVFFVLSGLLVGPAAVLGEAVGYVVFQAMQGVSAAWGGLSLLVFGLLARLFWGQVGEVDVHRPPQIRSAAQVKEFLIVASLAALGSAIFLAWVYDVIRHLPFYPTALFVALSLGLSTVIGAGIVLVVVPGLLGEDRWRRAVDAVRPTRRSIGAGNRTWMAVTATIFLAWFLGGSAVSVGFQVIDLVPPFHIRVRGLDPLLLFSDRGPFDQGGTTLQLAIGAAFLTLWLLSVRRWNILTISDD